MRSWAIVHFQPPEKYPPVVNFVRYAVMHKEAGRPLHLITTHPGEGKTILDFPGVTVHRVAKWKNRSRIQRLVFYLWFNVKSFWALTKSSPESILYYETLSAFGPWLYKKINRRVKVYIHYHEYTSVDEYNTGMAMNRRLHAKELWLYKKAAWVSHTNGHRMKLFLEDVRGYEPSRTGIFPNYPPYAWFERARLVSANNDRRIGFVYVGALSMKTMYTVQMANFVAAHADECYWDIYSDNHEAEAIAYLKKLGASNISFKGGVQYEALPAILPKYDIGVILYTGDTLNYKYNAPNKFFEYLICGLNVWYPLEMETMQAFEQPATKPWVQGMDFSALSLPRPPVGCRIDNLPEPEYTAEKVCSILFEALKSDKE